MTLSQETRWAYSTTLPSPHVGPEQWRVNTAKYSRQLCHNETSRNINDNKHWTATWTDACCSKQLSATHNECLLLFVTCAALLLQTIKFCQVTGRTRQRVQLAVITEPSAKHLISSSNTLPWLCTRCVQLHNSPAVTLITLHISWTLQTWIHSYSYLLFSATYVFHHISCHGCSQWWTPLLGSSFPRQGSSTSLRSFVSCTGWRLQSGLHSNNQSSCTSVYTGPHLYTLQTSFVRWQMSRLVSDSVPVHLHHWLSAAPDSLPSVTELSRSPLHVS